MLASIVRQDVNDPTTLNANLIKTLNQTPPNSNPYVASAKYVSDLLEQRAPLTPVSLVDENAPKPVWLVALPVVFLFLFACQIIISILCIFSLRRVEKFWLAKISKTGIFYLNTKYFCLILGSLFSVVVSLDLVTFLLAIFDFTGADSRFLILSLEWLPCFLAGWIFLWGIAAGVFESAFETKERPMPKNSVIFFNFFAIILPLVMTFSQATFFLIAQNRMINIMRIGESIQAVITMGAPKYNPKTFNATKEILPNLIPLKNIIPLESEMAAYLIVGRLMWIAWALILLGFTVPLVVMHLKALESAIQKISKDCRIDVNHLQQLAERESEHPFFHEEPFSSSNGSALTPKQLKAVHLHNRFQAERRANKLSLAIFLCYLSVYLFLSIANRATTGMDQYDSRAGLTTSFLIFGRAILSILGFSVTLKFYMHLRTNSKEALERGAGSMFGAGIQFQKELSAATDDACLPQETNDEKSIDRLNRP
ncbi:hypothetical protein O181_022791 [Austropuccinia psidii MF-1]|uniref:Uncharacterized protein n=1 Tax=Austropuccinia psidii MF-1 TaxID=1389203 RepID=A0A9Q3CDM0_9BASI|nr:hypothetical protein [Austropuccinia psidii MF-1]